MSASDGGIFTFGGAPFKGSMGGKHLNAPIVGMATTSTGNGYWLVASDGGIFAFGDAPYKGSMGGKHLNAPIVGMAATSDNKGYWLVASDGGIFAFGDAPYKGSMGGKHLNAPDRRPGGHVDQQRLLDGGVRRRHLRLRQRLVQRVDGQQAPQPTHRGHRRNLDQQRLLAGGFRRRHLRLRQRRAIKGSMGNKHLNRPIVGMEASPSDNGYRLVASDGGIFTFGDAPFNGSEGGAHLNAPIVAIGV